MPLKKLAISSESLLCSSNEPLNLFYALMNLTFLEVDCIASFARKHQKSDLVVFRFL